MHQYITEFEGVPIEINMTPCDNFDEIEEFNALIMDYNLSDDEEHYDLNHNSNFDDSQSSYLTDLGMIDSYHAITLLNDQPIQHLMTRSDQHDKENPKHVITAGKRYGSSIFQGIVMDTGAAILSTAG